MLSNNGFLLLYKKRLYDRFSHNSKGIKKDCLKFAIHNIKGWASNESMATFQQERLQHSSNPGQEIQKFSHMERLLSLLLCTVPDP